MEFWSWHKINKETSDRKQSLILQYQILFVKYYWIQKICMTLSDGAIAPSLIIVIGTDRIYKNFGVLICMDIKLTGQI